MIQLLTMGPTDRWHNHIFIVQRSKVHATTRMYHVSFSVAGNRLVHIILYYIIIG